MAHFAEIILPRDLEFQRNSQTRISKPDAPTAETAVTIAQIMSLIIRPYYPRDGRPAVQNCTEHMEGSHPLLVTTHHLAVDQAGPHIEVIHGLDHKRVALRPVVAPAGDQPDAHGIAAGHQPEAVVLDLVNPV